MVIGLCECTVHWQVLAERNVSRYGWLYRWCDELFTAAHLLLEHYHLQQHCKYMQPPNICTTWYRQQINIAIANVGKHNIFYLVILPIL